MSNQTELERKAEIEAIGKIKNESVALFYQPMIDAMTTRDLARILHLVIGRIILTDGDEELKKIASVLGPAGMRHFKVGRVKKDEKAGIE